MRDCRKISEVAHRRQCLPLYQCQRRVRREAKRTCRWILEFFGMAEKCLRPSNQTCASFDRISRTTPSCGYSHPSGNNELNRTVLLTSIGANRGSIGLDGLLLSDRTAARQIHKPIRKTKDTFTLFTGVLLHSEANAPRRNGYASIGSR